MQIENITHSNTTTYTIQYGDSWLNNYLTYTEWVDDRGMVIDWTLTDQDGNTITDEAVIESVHEYVDNLAE